MKVNENMKIKDVLTLGERMLQVTL